MRFSHENNLIFFIMVSLLGVTLFGFLVILPIWAIQSLWNLVTSLEFASSMPAINYWQAILLYLALVLMIYVSGLVKIELKIKRLDLD